MDAPSIFLRAAQLRAESKAIAKMRRNATDRLLAQSDAAILLRTQTKRIMQEASRLDQLRHWSELRIYRGFTFFGQMVDAELCEEPRLLAELNEAGCECDVCRNEETIVAVIRFSDLSSMLAVCVGCFQELNEMSLGQVT